MDTPCKDHTCTCTIALDEDGIINLNDIRLCGFSMLPIVGIGFVSVDIILSNIKYLFCPPAGNTLVPLIQKPTVTPISNSLK